MKKFIRDISDEVCMAIERALYEQDESTSSDFVVKSGKIIIKADHNDNMDIEIVHNNGVVREHENIKNAIYAEAPCWGEVREAIRGYRTVMK